MKRELVLQPSSVLRFYQEIGYRHRIEVEHLGAVEFSITEVIQSEHLLIYAVPESGTPALMP